MSLPSAYAASGKTHERGGPPLISTSRGDVLSFKSHSIALHLRILEVNALGWSRTRRLIKILVWLKAYHPSHLVHERVSLMKIESVAGFDGYAGDQMY